MSKKTDAKKPPAKAKPATKQVRRKKYEPADFIDEICSRLSDGETLRSICRSEGMPSWDVVYVWANGDDELAQRIARAREAGYDAIAMEALEIADTPKEGVSTVEDDKGSKEIREDMLGHRKLQVETRLKLLAKWCPKRYGDAQKLELSGKDGGAIVVSEQDRAAKLAGLMALANARKEKAGKGED